MDGAGTTEVNGAAAGGHAERWRLQLRHHLPGNHVPQRTVLDREPRHVASRCVRWYSWMIDVDGFCLVCMIASSDTSRHVVAWSAVTMSWIRLDLTPLCDPVPLWVWPNQHLLTDCGPEFEPAHRSHYFCHWKCFVFEATFISLISFLSHVNWTELNWTELDKVWCPVQFRWDQMRWSMWTCL